MSYPNISGTSSSPSSSSASAPRALIATSSTRSRRTVLAVAATVVGLSLSACSGIDGSQTDAAPPENTVSASQDTRNAEEAQDAQGAEDAQDDSSSDIFTVALDKTAKWNDGLEARLSDFSRGTSGEYAGPSGEDYLAFSVTMRNGSEDATDLSMVMLSCPDGAEEVYDTDAGFGGTPDTHLLPGKSQTWEMACVFPKTAKSAQIEITPTDTSGSGWYRTAIFTGEVR